MPKTDNLNPLLADYHVFYQKLRGYHWNVVGPRFFQLHALFEKLYNEVSEHIDEVAERIRSLDAKPVSTLKGYLEIARLKEDAGAPAPDAMVKNIAADLTALTKSVREAARAAEEGGDVGTANLLDDIADGQEKTIWMLRSAAA